MPGNMSAKMKRRQTHKCMCSSGECYSYAVLNYNYSSTQSNIVATF